jgi:hypothetical protein
MSLAEIERALEEKIPRRTLQRRIAALVDRKRLEVIGEGRSTRYRLAPITGAGNLAAQPAVIKGEAEVYVPISPASEEIKAYVRQPIQGRRPVGYDMAFLESYVPNETAYLPEDLRRQLHAIGRSPAADDRAGTFAREILNRLLIDLSWASSRLEGNTYSRLDTERLIEFGQRAEGKDATETQMILNHKTAIEYLVHDIGRVGVNAESIVAIHALLSDGLLPPVEGGRLRQRAVEIGGSVYLPMALPQRIEEVFGIVLETAARISDAIEQAFFLMVHLPYLQPFEDVNKRVSRLAANIPLVRENLCPLSFIDVPQKAYIDGILGVYELNRVDLLRDVFVWAYERSCQQYVAVRGQLMPPDPFRLRYRAQLAECIRAVVRVGPPATEVSIRRVVPAAVARDDADQFVKLVLLELEGLHPGNAVRFGLRPLELAPWEKADQ